MWETTTKAAPEHIKKLETTSLTSQWESILLLRDDVASFSKEKTQVLGRSRRRSSMCGFFVQSQCRCEPSAQ